VLADNDPPRRNLELDLMSPAGQQVVHRSLGRAHGEAG